MADGQAVLEPLDGLDDNEGASEGQSGTEGQQQAAGGAEGSQQTQGESQSQDDGPYSAKTSKEFSNALKAWRDSGPDGAKYARMAKDDHSRLFQLHQLEPEGIDGVRAKYALLDSVVHGELKGLDAVTAMQDALQSYSDVDQLIAAGDPKALDELGEDFNDGLAKLTPSILARIAAANPQAYADAILPHFVEALRSSDLVKSFNGLVDTLNEQPPTWLTADQKSQWINDKLGRVLQAAGGMGEWLNAQAEKAKGANVTVGDPRQRQTQRGSSTLDQREQAIAQKEQATYWESSIAPQTNQIASKAFDEQFRSYEKRLKLDQASKNALVTDFVAGVTKKALAKKADGSPSDYSRQMQRYHGQRNPSAQAVINFFSVEFNKHARTVMQELINTRYKPFLEGKPNNQAQSGTTKPAGSTNPGASKQIQYVSVKPAPDSYDPSKRSIKDIYDDLYRLRDGRVVKFKRA